MPDGLKRYQQGRDLHFLTWSCYHRQPYLIPERAKIVFEEILEETRRDHRVRVYGYVIMPEHVHLLMSEPAELPLAQILKSLKQKTSRLLKGDRDHFWQKRYYDHNIRPESDDRFHEKLRYLHRNPVARGLAARPEDYPWSSFLHYRTGVRGRVEIESEWLAAERRRRERSTSAD